MKNIISTVVCVMCGICLAATPQVKNVKAFQQYPWGKVCITYEVVGDVAASAEGGNNPFLFVTAKDKTTGLIYDEAAPMYLSGDTSDTVGLHTIIWDISAQGVPIGSNNVAIDVAYHDTDELYLVVDLSSGANSLSYPISYLHAVPSGGWSYTYKADKLVLRRIAPGAFKMCGEHDVALTKPFYIGVFEVTQRQYELVMGSNPSYYNHSYDTRPVDCVSYNMIRGSSFGAGWPGSSAVDGDSFLGKIRTRTGLDFDLPTEAQWEYACRAGTMTDYNNGKNNTGKRCKNMDEVGRYMYNGGMTYNSDTGSYFYPSQTSITEGTTGVGHYQPNAWGLYDMHGNVEEWCRDWFGGLGGGTDPHGPASGTGRVFRGGRYSLNATFCTSSTRNGAEPSMDSAFNLGFRLARTLSD